MRRRRKEVLCFPKKNLRRRRRKRMTYGSRSFACVRCSRSIILYANVVCLCVCAHRSDMLWHDEKKEWAREQQQQQRDAETEERERGKFVRRFSKHAHKHRIVRRRKKHIRFRRVALEEHEKEGGKNGDLRFRFPEEKCRWIKFEDTDEIDLGHYLQFSSEGAIRSSLCFLVQMKSMMETIGMPPSQKLPRNNTKYTPPAYQQTLLT